MKPRLRKQPKAPSHYVVFKDMKECAKYIKQHLIPSYLENSSSLKSAVSELFEDKVVLIRTKVLNTEKLPTKLVNLITDNGKVTKKKNQQTAKKTKELTKKITKKPSKTKEKKTKDS